MHASVEARPPIAFIDLERQLARLRPRLVTAMTNVLDHGGYIHGPEVAELEARLARFCGARHAVGCANGTDALILALKALRLEPGDAVLVPAFTFCATAEAVAAVGGVPLFVDVDENSFNTTAAALEAGLRTARRLGLRVAGAITVDLFGQPCDYDAIQALLDDHGLWLICDAAQAFGAVYRGRPVGTIGRLTTTSFFPAKPLGCYGDGGAVFTDDEGLAATLRSLRVHGQGRDKYDNVRIGLNSRLDTVQAAILLHKLDIFGDELQARDAAAKRYAGLLGDAVRAPVLSSGSTSSWAQYTLRLGARDKVAAALADQGIPTAIYYRIPLHQQEAYRRYPVADGGLPVSERLSRQVLSLPMHPYLTEEEQDRIATALLRACEARGQAA